MLKLIGALCILGGCGYVGFRIGEQYRKRSEMLRYLQNGLNLLETEISYGATPLPLALARIGEKMKGESRIPFVQAARLLQNRLGLTAAEAWEEGILQLSSQIPLSREEISILVLFGHGLGCSAREEQLKNIALAREQLRMAETAAEEARLKNQRMCQYMGLCCGGVLVLLLI